MTPHATHDGLLRDMCDGQYYKEHPLYSVQPNALQLHLFYDDMEVVNPIGTKTKKHKLCENMYCTCACGACTAYSNFMLM